MASYKALKNHAGAQARVLTTENGLVLYSYRTEVIKLENGWLQCYGLYSMTTRKHIGWFLREYLPQFSFQDIKLLYNAGMKMNIVTGECVKP